MIYIIHFETAYRHAKHYVGYCTDGRSKKQSQENLDARLDAHRHGRGSRLMEVITAAGITWSVAKVRPGGRSEERQLKKRGGASRYCPLCKAERKTP